MSASRRTLVVGLGLASLSACAPLPAREDVAAVLVAPTAASRAELREVVSRALNGTAVTIADDALTRSSTLLLERPEPGNRLDRPATGRTLGAPVQFRLVTDGSGCFLLYGSERLELSAARCVPE